LFIRADLANAVENIDLDALPGEPGEEAADGVWRPAIASAICGPLAPSLRPSMART
jgi:hypothetical protein